MSGGLRDILERLQQRSRAKREEALEELYEVELKKRDWPLLCEAVLWEFPDDRVNEVDNIRSTLLSMLEDIPDKRTVGFIDGVFPKLPSNPAIRQSALSVLVSINTRESLRVLRELLVAHRPKLRDAPDMLFFDIMSDPKNSSVMFPGILELLQVEEYRIDVYRLAVACYDSGAIGAAAVKPLSGRVLKDWAYGVKVRSSSGLSRHRRARNEEYLAAVARFFPVATGGKRLLGVVSDAMHDKSPFVALAAARSCVVMGVELTDAAIKALSSNAATLLGLVELLDGVGLLSRVPKRFLEQERVARADLVRWLCHPNEYSRPPSKLRLSECMVIKHGGSKQRLYVYEYQYPESMGEWEVGISGPQPLDESELSFGGELTYSAGLSAQDMGVKTLIQTAKLHAEW